MEDSSCVVCGERSATVGVLCVSCAGRLPPPDRFCPEQIVAHFDEPRAEAANAWLVDAFGRPHHVCLKPPAERACASTVLGRSANCGLAVADGSVSLIHAELVYSDYSGSWYITDRDSANKTRVNDEVIRQCWLDAGDLVSLAEVSLLFVPIAADELDAFVARYHRERGKHTGHATFVNAITHGSMPSEPVGLVLEEADGGGFARLGERTIQLSVLELELLTMLVTKRAEAGDKGSAAEFVPSRILTTQLSFETARPTNNHLKALIRRTRNKFAAQGVSDIIESRMGLGYRVLAR